MGHTLIHPNEVMVTVTGDHRTYVHTLKEEVREDDPSASESASTSSSTESSASSSNSSSMSSEDSEESTIGTEQTRKKTCLHLFESRMKKKNRREGTSKGVRRMDWKATTLVER
jgi:hypothetical protein